MPFFDSWMDIGRVLLFGLISYSALVLLLRISGTRTVSQFNSFDLVITMTFGTLLASMLTSKSLSLITGLTAFATVIILQYVFAVIAMRVEFFDKIIKATPTLLYYKGEFSEKMMKEKRIQYVEVLQSVRSQGLGSLDEVEAIVLETNAQISVIRKSNKGDLGALENVTGFSEFKKDDSPD